MNEDYAMPWDMIAYYVFSLIVFLMSLVSSVYERNVYEFMVYTTYAILGALSIVLGWGLLKAIQGMEE